MHQRRAGLAPAPSAHAASRAGERRRAEAAPSRRSRARSSCLTVGALSGITIHAGMPRRARRIRERRAVVARRMRDDAARAPRRRTARTRRCIAPRALNAPTFCRFSHLKNSARPPPRRATRQVSTGVRCTCGAIRACAARIAARSTASRRARRLAVARHRLSFPAAPWTFGKNRSFHDSGFTLIDADLGHEVDVLHDVLRRRREDDRPDRSASPGSPRPCPCPSTSAGTLRPPPACRWLIIAVASSSALTKAS